MPYKRRQTRKRKSQSRKTRKSQIGGFFPSVMGGFLANAQATVLPMAAFRVFRTFTSSRKNNK